MSSDSPSSDRPQSVPAALRRDTDHFVDRHIGPRVSDQQAMLARIGHDSLDSLMRAAVPESIRASAPPALPEALGSRRRSRLSRPSRRATTPASR